MNIEGRIVTGDLDLLRFLYPDYEEVREIPLFPSRNAIYCGDGSNLEEFIDTYRKAGLKFIVYNKYHSEINLRDRFVLLSIIFYKYKRSVPKYVYNMMDTLEEDIFINLCKHFWLTGEWLQKEINYEGSFLDFVSSLNTSKREMMQSYFKVVKETGAYRIEGSLLTFFIRSRDRDYKGKSIIYNRMLNNFKGNRLKKVRLGIENSFKYHIDNRELRLLNMMMQIIE